MEAALHPWPALGALLLRDGLVTRERLEAVLAEQRDSPHQRISGKRLGESLVEQGLVTATQVAQLVAEQYSLPFVELTESEVGIRAAVLVSEDLARRTSALPISVLPDNSLLVALADPALALFSDELHAALGVPLRFAVTTADAMDAAITYAFERAKLLVLTEPVAPVLEESGTEPLDELLVRPEPDRVEESTPEVGPSTLTSPWPVLGAMLIRDDLVSEADLDAALAQQRVSGSRRLGEILVDRGAVSATDIARLVAEQYELTFVDLDASDLDLAVASRLDEELAKKYSAVVVSAGDGEVLLALADPTRVLDAHELRSAFDSPVRFVAAAPDAVRDAIERAYAAPASSSEPARAPYEAITEDDDVSAAEASESIVPPAGEVDPTIVDDLLEATASALRPEDGALDREPESSGAEAAVELEPEPESSGSDAAFELELEPEPEATVAVVGRNAEASVALPDVLSPLTDVLTTLRPSHVHLSPFDDGLVVRARVDGVVRTVATLSSDDASALVGALKGLARLDPGPRRTPCECGLRYPTGEHELDVRLAIVPTVAGEKLTLAVRDYGTTELGLDALGLQADAVEVVRGTLTRPAGALVLSGPTASGRTTTLYAALVELRGHERTIASVEHPVERALPGVDQVQVSPGAGLTHGRALQAVVRSDYDVLAVGELTDAEAARASLGAAGSRLVVATLEAPSVAAALRRVAHAGSSPFGENVVGAVSLVVSQRLVRRICTDCRETYYADADELVELGRPSEEAGRRLLARGRGCPACGDTGYRGRVGLFELLVPTAEIWTLASGGASVTELERAAALEGMRSLSSEGADLCLDGVTTVAELRRVLGDTVPA